MRQPVRLRVLGRERRTEEERATQRRRERTALVQSASEETRPLILSNFALSNEMREALMALADRLAPTEGHPIAFRKTVPAATADVEEKRVPFNAVVKAAFLHFPPGTNQLVEVRLAATIRGTLQYIIPAEVDSYIALDDTFMPMQDLHIPLAEGTVLRLEVYNYDGANEHTVPVTLVLRQAAPGEVERIMPVLREAPVSPAAAAAAPAAAPLVAARPVAAAAARPAPPRIPTAVARAPEGPPTTVPEPVVLRPEVSAVEIGPSLTKFTPRPPEPEAAPPPAAPVKTPRPLPAARARPAQWDGHDLQVGDYARYTGKVFRPPPEGEVVRMRRGPGGEMHYTLRTDRGEMEFTGDKIMPAERSSVEGTSTTVAPFLPAVDIGGRDILPEIRLGPERQ